MDPETGRARAVVPADWQGWADVEGGNAKVFLFVRSKTPLSVELKAEQVSYAPGQIAHLAVDTSVGGAPGQAAVLYDEEAVVGFGLVTSARST